MHLVLNDIDLGRDYQLVLSEVAAQGDRVSPRGVSAVEVRPLVLRLPDPTRCITKRPHFNRALMWLEIAQLLAGEYDRELYEAVSPNAAALITPYGAYGPRVWPQLLDVEAELQRDASSRRAVVYIGRPDDMRLAAQYPPEQLDFPCTLSWQFFARGGLLEMIVNMRSWDLVWGLGYDVPAFVSVQLALADALDLKPGPYTHVAGSGHIYERHLGVAKYVEQTNEQLPSANLDGQPMVSLRESACIALAVARRTLLAGEAAPQVGSWAPAFSAWAKLARRPV